MANYVDGAVYDWKAVTPSDSVPIPLTNGIYVDVTGSLILTSVNGNTETFSNVAAGICHPFAATKVGASSGATGIKALYYRRA